MTLGPQLSLGVTGGHDALAAAHAPQGGRGFKAQSPGFGYNQVGNLVGFEVAPHIFHRIEFRCKKVTRNLTFKEWEDLIGKDVTYNRQSESLPVPNR
jgi:uncharacterized protein YcfJ